MEGVQNLTVASCGETIAGLLVLNWWSSTIFQTKHHGRKYSKCKYEPMDDWERRTRKISYVTTQIYSMISSYFGPVRALDRAVFPKCELQIQTRFCETFSAIRNSHKNICNSLVNVLYIIVEMKRPLVVNPGFRKHDETIMLPWWC